MAPRTLASLAHALGSASDLDAALVALGEGLAEFDRSAHLSLIRYDARREMLRDAVTPAGGRATPVRVETTIDHLPGPLRVQIAAGGQFVDFGDQSPQFARLLSLPAVGEGGALSLRGLRFEGALSAVLALYEPRRIFGTRVSERFAPAAALFDLAYVRFAEQEARLEAVQTLENVTQRVHGEYLRTLGQLEAQLETTRAATPAGGDPAREIALERRASEATEEARRAKRRADGADQQISAAVGQLEQAHVELHRRSEALRQKTRTLYLIDRVLSLDAEAIDPRQLVDGLLALVGDDMQSQRCSLMLRAPEPNTLFVAAMRGHSPEGLAGERIRIGEGVSGKVALSREPLLVQDVTEANSHPLLHDQPFTTGSFISFPLVYHGDLVGVINLSDRARGGTYGEEDVERVRLLALLVSLVACHANLAERLGMAAAPPPPGAPRPAGAF